MTVIYFYRYMANKQGDYDKFKHGELTVTNHTEAFSVYSEVTRLAHEEFPDADNIDITCITRL